MNAPIAQGPTLQDELDWITEHDDHGGPFADFIAASRYKAVYGSWPDGKKPAFPKVPGMTPVRIKWLDSQSHPGKWIRHQIRAGIIPAPTGPTPKRETPVPAVQAEAFAGQDRWERQHRARVSRSDDSRSRNLIREIGTKLEQERQFLLTWFGAMRFKCDDAEWQRNFMRLRSIEEMLSLAQLPPRRKGRAIT